MSVCLVNMTLGRPHSQGVAKAWGQNLFPGLTKNGDQLNKSLSRETIFLATTLGMREKWIDALMDAKIQCK